MSAQPRPRGVAEDIQECEKQNADLRRQIEQCKTDCAALQEKLRECEARPPKPPLLPAGRIAAPVLSLAGLGATEADIVSSPFAVEGGNGIPDTHQSTQWRAESGGGVIFAAELSGANLRALHLSGLAPGQSFEVFARYRGAALGFGEWGSLSSAADREVNQETAAHCAIVAGHLFNIQKDVEYALLGRRWLVYDRGETQFADVALKFTVSRASAWSLDYSIAAARPELFAPTGCAHGADFPEFWTVDCGRRWPESWGSRVYSVDPAAKSWKLTAAHPVVLRFGNFNGPDHIVIGAEQICIGYPGAISVSPDFRQNPAAAPAGAQTNAEQAEIYQKLADECRQNFDEAGAAAFEAEARAARAAAGGKTES